MGRRKIESIWKAENLFEYLKDPHIEDWNVKEGDEIIVENIGDEKTAHLIAAAPLLLDTLRHLLLKGGITHANRQRIKKVVSIAENKVCTRNIDE